jgi:hypothetical protein
VLGDGLDFLDAGHRESALLPMSRAASGGTMPALAIASTAAISTCSHFDGAGRSDATHVGVV